MCRLSAFFFVPLITDILCYLCGESEPGIFKDIDICVIVLGDFFKGEFLFYEYSGVDGCDCEETLKLIAEGKLDTEPLITHTYPLSQIAEAYELFENKRGEVIKVAVEF